MPVLAAHRLDARHLFLSFLAFVAFSLLASSVYIINDLFDIDADRAHPRKRGRPFASGALKQKQGARIACCLIVISISIGVYVGPMFAFILLCYLIISSAYTAFLKKELIVDICILASLYTIRIVAGGVATSISLSVWLLAFSVFFFLSLAAVKRQAELVDGISSEKLQVYGRGYRFDDLPIISNMALSSGYVSVLIMALYINSPEVIVLYRHPFAIWGICLVLLYWISRIVMVTHRGAMHDDPIIYALKDRISYYCLALILISLISGVLP